MKQWKKNRKWVLAALSLIGFIFISINIQNQKIIPFDLTIYEFTSKYLINNTMTFIMKGITFLGDIKFVILLTLGCFFFTKSKKISLAQLMNLGMCGILNQIMKYSFQRPRPTYYPIVKESGFSFPSGHAMVSLVFYGLFIYFIWKSPKLKKSKIPFIILNIIFIILIGISRIYLGVHYASDILGGYLLATAYLIGFISILENIEKRGKKNEK